VAALLVSLIFVSLAGVVLFLHSSKPRPIKIAVMHRPVQTRPRR